MNVQHLQQLQRYLRAVPPEDIRILPAQGGCDIISHINRVILASQTIESEPFPPSPATWLGFTAEQMAKFPANCALDDYKPVVRKHIILDLLGIAINEGVLDWHRAKAMNDVEVSA